MGRGDRVPDDDHVLRHCPGGRIGRDGDPKPAAFMLRENEEYLSVNWLEHSGQPDLAAAVRHAEGAVGRFRQLRKSCRFAVLNVGAVKTAIATHAGIALRVEHLPLEGNPSHSGIFGHAAADRILALDIANELAALVRREDMHPAVA